MTRVTRTFCIYIAFFGEMNMTAQTSVYGRLTVDPQPHQTRTGINDLKNWQ